MDKRIGDISAKYEDSFQFLQARKKRQASQLRLLINLQKGDQTIASTLLLTLFNRALSQAYDDHLQVKFLPSQGINQDQINAYNILAQSDYQEMNKAKIDYDLCWDTLFFGRSYLETLKFNKKRKIMEPHVINPLVFGYDPIVSEVQDWRYYWKWITRNKWEIQKLIDSGKITGISTPEEIPSGMEDYIWEYKVVSDQAKLGVPPSPNPGSLDIYQILEFAGYDDDGDRCLFWVDKYFSKVLMTEKLDLNDGEIEGESKWPIVTKEAYRDPHSSIQFSMADLLDDKHRAKSVLLNLAFIAAKDRANPVYLYNSDKVDDVTQFLSRQINQHIPVSDIEGAVKPMNTEEPMSAGLMQFISILTNEAGEPVGAGSAIHPMGSPNKQTATESSIDQQLNNMANSLISKVMQFGEQEFWSHWFQRYAKNADAVKMKMANIVGVKGVESTEIDMSLFHSDFPPGVMVYSAKEAEEKNLVKRRDMMQLYPEASQTMDSDGFRNFNKYVFWPLVLEDPSLIDIMYPTTLDERKAQDENEQLKEDKMPDVADTDNHTTHIYVHHQVQPKTNALWMHIAWHEELLAQQKQMAGNSGSKSEPPKVNVSLKGDISPQVANQLIGGQPGMEATPEQQQSPGALGGAGKVGAEKKSPMSMASPLKTEIKSNMAQK